jgi:CubicO group peptidase (beta-lactamase class C family)
MSASHDAHWDDLCEYAAKLVKGKGVPGVVVGVLHKGEIATTGFGVTNVNHPLPVTDETLFEIASITKTFTGTAIMRLFEMGELEIDAPVRTYVPDFAVVDEPASAGTIIRHLLTHTAGWDGELYDDTGAGDDAVSRYVDRMADLEQLAPPGTDFSYNNAGFVLAGYIIEMVTGQSYQSAMKDLVLEPLGLQNCHFNSGDVMLHRFVVGHEVNDEGTHVTGPWPVPRSLHPAGGLVCHMQDLMRYARFHLGDGTTDAGDRLLSAESMAQMHSPQVTIGGSEALGFAWMMNDTHGTRQVTHSGGWIGQVCELSLFPEHDFAVAVLANANRGGAVVGDVIGQALQRYLGLENTSSTPAKLSEADSASYAGRYTSPSEDVELSVYDGTLMRRVTDKHRFPEGWPPLPVQPLMSCVMYEKDRFNVLDDHGSVSGKIDIVRKSDGSIGWLRSGLRLLRRAE